MKKFEYKIVNTKDLPEYTAIDELNSLGDVGWQLIWVDSYKNKELWTMMREKENV